MYLYSLANTFNQDLENTRGKISEEIEQVREDYFKCLKFPRKEKKRCKKELLSRYSLLVWMRDYSVQFTW